MFGRVVGAGVSFQDVFVSLSSSGKTGEWRNDVRSGSIERLAGQTRIVENSTHQLRNGVWTGGNLH